MKDALVCLDTGDYSRVIRGYFFIHVHVLVKVGQEPAEELLMGSEVSVNKSEKRTFN